MTGARWDSDLLLAADTELQAHIADGVAHGGGGSAVPKTLLTDFLVLITGPNAAIIYDHTGANRWNTTTDIASIWGQMKTTIMGRNPVGANVRVRALPNGAGNPYQINIKKTLNMWHGGTCFGPGMGKISEGDGHPSTGYVFVPDAAFVNDPTLPAAETTLFDVSNQALGLENFWISGFSADGLGRVANDFMVVGMGTGNGITLDHLDARGFTMHGYSLGKVNDTGGNVDCFGTHLFGSWPTEKKWGSIHTISMAGSGLVTVTTSGAHGLSTNQPVQIHGVQEAGRPGNGVLNVFNGFYKVTVTGGTTFTYQVADGTLGAHTGVNDTGGVYNNRAIMAAYLGDLNLTGPGNFAVPTNGGVDGSHSAAFLQRTHGEIIHFHPGWHLGGGSALPSMPRIIILGGGNFRYDGHYLDNVFAENYGAIYIAPEKGLATVNGTLLNEYFNHSFDGPSMTQVAPWVTIDNTKKGTITGISIINPLGNGDNGGAPAGSPAILRLVNVPSDKRIRLRGPGNIGGTRALYELFDGSDPPDVEDINFRPASGTGLDGRSRIKGAHTFVGAGTFTVNPNSPLFANPTEIQLSYSGAAFRNVRAENIGGAATGSFDITVDGACTVYYKAYCEL